LSISKEYDRVLRNPDNVIVSKSLEDIIDLSENKIAADEVGVLISGETLTCSVKKVKVHKDQHEFSLVIPAFDLTSFLKNNDALEVIVDDMEFRQVDSTPVVWKDNLLTITTRRIFNETVQA